LVLFPSAMAALFPESLVSTPALVLSLPSSPATCKKVLFPKMITTIA
jgi:hypothetical protein